MSERLTGGDLTGGSTNYYKVKIELPTTAEEPYMAECNDIIEALNMTFAEGNILKAIWRMAAGRMNKGKPGTTYLYDAEKVEFYAKRILMQEQIRLGLQTTSDCDQVEDQSTDPEIAAAAKTLSRMAKVEKESNFYSLGDSSLCGVNLTSLPRTSPYEQEWKEVEKRALDAELKRIVKEAEIEGYSFDTNDRGAS